MLSIHEEFHRLILRKRWILLVKRFRSRYGYRPHHVYFLRMYRRLKLWAPTWDERRGFPRAIDAGSGTE